MNQNYKTKCQFLASTLYAQGFLIESIERINGECFFIFENKKNAEKIVRKYYSSDLKVDPRKLFNSFKDIKSMIFN